MTAAPEKPKSDPLRPGGRYEREGAIRRMDENIVMVRGGHDTLVVETVAADPLGRDVLGWISFDDNPKVPFSTSFELYEKGGWKAVEG